MRKSWLLAVSVMTSVMVAGQVPASGAASGQEPTGVTAKQELGGLTISQSTSDYTELSALRMENARLRALLDIREQQIVVYEKYRQTVNCAILKKDCKPVKSHAVSTSERGKK
jgi:hypothetical protein